MTLRVLHLLRSLRVGGLENVVLGLVNGLSLVGVECHLGCLVEEGEWMDRADARGVWVGRLEQRTKAPVILSLCRYLRREKIALIHSHNSQAHLFGVAASLLTGIPIVHTKHGQNWPDNPRWVWTSRQASRFTRKIVAVSSDIARIVTEIERVPPRKVVTIVNGIDVKRFAPPGNGGPAGTGRGAEVRQRVGIPPDAFVVGSVGRLAWEKNYELLVRSFASFHRTESASRLLLVGDGPLRQDIQRAVEEVGVADACILAGAQDDVAPWLAAMDVFCLSSLTEGTSITLLEAGAAGLPAIVTNVGGNAEVVADGSTGIVVPRSDGDAFAGAMQALSADGDRRGAMGSAARRRMAERYSQEHMVSEYLAVYRAA